MYRPLARFGVMWLVVMALGSAWACGDGSSGPDVPEAGVDGFAVDAPTDSVVADAVGDAMDAMPTGWGTVTSPTVVYAVGADALGNSIVGGAAKGHAWVEKLSSSGTVVWESAFTTGSTFPQASSVEAIATDGVGNVYASGTTLEALLFDGSHSLAPGFFVVKLDASGKVLWAKNTAALSDAIFALPPLAVRANGNPVVAGILRKSTTIGGTPLTLQGTYDALVIELAASDGSVVAVRRWGGPGSDTITAAALDPNGNLFLAGQFNAGFDFGGPTLAAADGGASQSYIVKLGPAYGFLAQRVVPSASFYALKATSTGKLYVGGQSNGTTTLGGSDLTTQGGNDAIIGMLDETLGHQWSKRFGGAKDEGVQTVLLDGNAAPVFVGRFSSPPDFGLGPMAGPNGIFFARFDPSGNFVNATSTATGAAPPQVHGAASTGPKQFSVVGYATQAFTLPSGVFQPVDATYTYFVAGLTF
jgi:hypothetical protein